MKLPGRMAGEVLQAVFLPPATTKYPAERPVVPPNFRGRIKFVAPNCIGCKLCMRDCPTNCVTITKVGDKRFSAAFDLDKCIYCAQCVDSCPKAALEITPEFELAQLQRSGLRLVFDAPPAPPPPSGEAAPPPKAPGA